MPGEILTPLREDGPLPLSAAIPDTTVSNILAGTDEADTFILSRDARWDRIEGFEDGSDRIDIQSYDVTFESLLIERVSSVQYKVYTRDEGINVFLEESAAIDPDDWLLGEEDFVFRDGLADPPVQVHFEESATEREAITGTTLPDIFTFTPDGVGDTINRFEHGKDLIDLSAFNTAFANLSIVTRFDGRVSIRVNTQIDRDTSLYDWFQVNDRSDLLVASDFTAADFIF
ncbi:MAG: hypothetical protein AAF913_13285 [Pseudomonadota bacterium]